MLFCICVRIHLTSGNRNPNFNKFKREWSISPYEIGSQRGWAAGWLGHWLRYFLFSLSCHQPHQLHAKVVPFMAIQLPPWTSGQHASSFTSGGGHGNPALPSGEKNLGTITRYSHQIPAPGQPALAQVSLSVPGKRDWITMTGLDWLGSILQTRGLL